jgi:hypothetical protein
MGKVRGFTAKDKRAPEGRGMAGHEESKAWGNGEDRAVSEHDDLRDDFEHGLRHRELSKDGNLHVGFSNEQSLEKGESSQRVRPYEERLQRAAIAGVQIKAASGPSDMSEKNLHYAKNQYMDRASTSGAVRPWKPKGREAAERASRDV